MSFRSCLLGRPCLGLCIGLIVIPEFGKYPVFTGLLQFIDEIIRFLSPFIDKMGCKIQILFLSGDPVQFYQRQFDF